MRRAFACLVALALLAAARPASAYRPFDGTDADVAPLGVFELELGPAHWYSQAGQSYVIAPATVLNFGILPRTELVIDFQDFVLLQPEPGQPRARLLDTDVLLKHVFIPGSLQDEGKGPSMAVEAGPLVPNVNGAEGFGAWCNVIVSQRFPGVTAHLNDAASLTRGNLHFDWFTSLILEGSFEQPVRPVGELYVEHEWVTNVTTYSALVGAIWHARDGLDFDVGLREARIDDVRATEVRLGLTWGLAVWSPP